MGRGKSHTVRIDPRREVTSYCSRSASKEMARRQIAGKQPVVQSLIERGFIVPSEEPLARVKLTALAQQRLSKRGVGLNKS